MNRKLKTAIWTAVWIWLAVFVVSMATQAFDTPWQGLSGKALALWFLLPLVWLMSIDALYYIYPKRTGLRQQYYLPSANYDNFKIVKPKRHAIAIALAPLTLLVFLKDSDAA